jgi:DNA polymerase
MNRHQQMAAHLRVFADLGVTGISRDPAWRERQPIATASAPEDAAAHVSAAEPTSAAGDQAAVAPAPAHAALGEGSASPAPTGADAPGLAADQLAALRSEIGADCQRCVLHTLGRRQVVYGVGNPDADLMFVGEAPGADEDAQGEPFVGRAGQLLTKIIEAIGLARSDVYIANVIKCRPPGNRNPEPAEVATCSPFLMRQIDIIRPKVIVALGTFAAHALLQTDAPISRIRGHVHEFRGGIKLIPTFHPAFLLRSPDRKRDVWEDMKKVRALLADAD